MKGSRLILLSCLGEVVMIAGPRRRAQSDSVIVPEPHQRAARVLGVCRTLQARRVGVFQLEGRDLIDQLNRPFSH